ALRAATAVTVQAFYTAHNSRRCDVLAERIAVIAKSRPLTEDPAVIEPAVLRVKLLVEILRPLQRNIALIEEHIAEAFEAHPEADLYRGLPGAGPATAPRLLVAFGTDRGRYPRSEEHTSELQSLTNLVC